MIGTMFGWRGWGGTLLACGLVVLAAFAVPVRAPEEEARRARGEIRPEALVRADREEDLEAFLEIRRWSVSPAPVTPKPAAPRVRAEKKQAKRAVNPALAEMGYVGLLSTRGRHAVLLALPSGQVVRMVPGDTLPDGRILVSVTDNSLTLRAEGRPEEVLMLFPRAQSEARTPDGADGGRRARGARTQDDPAPPVPRSTRATR